MSQNPTPEEVLAQWDELGVNMSSYLHHLPIALREALAQRDYAEGEASVFFADATKLQTERNALKAENEKLRAGSLVNAVLRGRVLMKLEEIKKLIEAATPGPWELTEAPDWEKADECCDPLYTIDAPALAPTKENGWTGPTLIELKSYYPTAPKRVEDARFIAASRTLMPKLLAVAEAAYAVNELSNFKTMGELDDALAALEADE